MLQVLQYQKNGEIIVDDLPAPQCIEAGILVRTHSSLISAGTEKISVSNAQVSLIERAKKQPDQVQIVLDNIKKEGIVSTIKRVQNKLDSYKTLGYSAAGTVIESKCDNFSVGDRVACAGAGYALHSEIITIPRNLAVKIPDTVSFDDACYTTIASIALQGIRQADLRLGEKVAVIGLGLLGMLTVQFLKASGCYVAGFDINQDLFDKAKKYGANSTFISSKDIIKTAIANTDGYGFDAVIITASTSSNEPIEIAFDLCRKKGKVIIVGAVAMDVHRNQIYSKEIDLRISCSYGPGRYDANYEEYGNDYPYAFVRWTENRNMQTVVDLISSGHLELESMTTHKFNINDAVKAYDLISGKVNEPYLGIILNYPNTNKEIKRMVYISNDNKKLSDLKIGFVGAGGFAQSYLLPAIIDTNASLIGVSTANPVNAQTVAKRLNFKFSSTDSSELIKNPEINAIFCATRHDTHAKYVIESIIANKPVFVEKPLAVSEEELKLIDESIKKHNGRVMVGFNRRFSKSFKLINEFFAERKNPMFINYRVNAGTLPTTHWVYTNENKGRIIGEACHFIDCMIYLTNSRPIKVFAESISSNNTNIINHENISITVKFSDGSVGNLLYLSNGDSALAKEYCEVFCDGSTAIMNNFTSVELYRNKKIKKHNLDGKKGHYEEIIATIDAMKNSKNMPIDYNDIYLNTLTTIKVLTSLQAGDYCSID